MRERVAERAGVVAAALALRLTVVSSEVRALEVLHRERGGDESAARDAVGDRVELETIFRGVCWFLGCEVVIVVLLIAFPQISLFLPSLMQ